MIFVSAYTIGTPYEQEVQRLKESLDQFGVPLTIVGYAPGATWQQSVKVKAEIVRDMLAKQPEDVYWIDADAVCENPPTDLENEVANADFAAVWQRRRILNGASLFFRNNDLGKWLAQRWVDFMRGSPDSLTDQAALQHIVQNEARGMGVRVKRLPVYYAQVINSWWGKDVPGIVFRQHQANRKYKKLADRGWKEESDG